MTTSNPKTASGRGIKIPRDFEYGEANAPIIIGMIRRIDMSTIKSTLFGIGTYLRGSEGRKIDRRAILWSKRFISAEEVNGKARRILRAFAAR